MGFPFISIANCLGERSSDAAKLSYVKGNRKFNILGFFCLVTAMEIMYRTIQNTVFLTTFYPQIIADWLIPVCLWITFSYQYQERRKGSSLDHSPGLEWKNQILNMVHLTNTYFWSILSGILLICYTLYCFIHHIPIQLNVWHLLAISMILIFFYTLAWASHTYLYLLFLAAVPAILIYCIQWLSWAVSDATMIYFKTAFFVINYAFCAITIFYRERIKSIPLTIASILSGIGIIYCYNSTVPEWLTPRCILSFTIILGLIELILICWEKTLLYQLFLIVMPAFLICVTYWTSSLVTSLHMAIQHAFFMILHFGLYILIICSYGTPPSKKKEEKSTQEEDCVAVCDPRGYRKKTGGNQPAGGGSGRVGGSSRFSGWTLV